MSSNKYVIKIQEIIDKQFHSIFNNSHFFYTVIFLVSLLLISLMSLIQGAGNAILFIATLFSITFLLLMVQGLIPALDKYLFSTEKRWDRNKGFCFLVNIIISLCIVIPYFVLGSSSQIQLQLLGWDAILPVSYLIIYFGWNLVQIFYLKNGFNEISENVDEKVEEKSSSSKKKDSTCLILLVVAIAIPILIQLGLLLGFIANFIPQGGASVDPLLMFIGYNMFIFFLIIITAWRLATLHLRSKKNESINAFSSMFYILIWIIACFRSYSFINTFQNLAQASTSLDIITRLIDGLLMIITTIIVLRGLGEKVYDSVVFNKNNMPFYLFAFTTLYFVGQIVMITGAGNLPPIFANRNQINLLNNFLIILITVIFYWFYSEMILEKKGLIIKKRFYPEDVTLVIKDFKQVLEERKALDTNKFGDDDLNNFLIIHHLKVPKPEPIEKKTELKEPEPETIKQPEPENDKEPEIEDSSDDEKNSE